MTARVLLTSLLTASALLYPVASYAQGEDAKLAKQFELNNKGVDFLSQSNYQAAIDAFKASLSYGELDVTYLNLGRAYQRQGDCLAAQRQYLKAIDPETPKVGGEVSQQMDEAVKRFMADLNKTCPAYVTVSCDPPGMALYVNGLGPKPCDGEQRPYEPGRWEFEGRVEGQRTSPQALEVERMKEYRIQLALQIVKPSDPKDLVIKQPDPNPNSSTNPRDPLVVVLPPQGGQPVDQGGSTKTALALIGAGAAVIVAGVFWDTCGFSYFSQDSLNADRKSMTEAAFKAQTGWCFHTVNGRFDALDLAPATLYLGGALLTIFGINRF